MAIIDNWDDNFGLNKIQTGAVNGADFLSSESVLVCAGPPQFSTTNKLTPIGFVENAGVNQSKQLQQLFEIGSRKPFIIPGRTQISANLSRVLFNGKSLMKVLYQGNDAVEFGDKDLDYDTKNRTGPTAGEYVNGEYEGNFYINLAAEFFNAPIGLGFVMRDMKQNAYEGFFLEECWIQGHQFSMAAQQTVLLENVSLRATAVIPISTEELGGKGASDYHDNSSAIDLGAE